MGISPPHLRPLAADLVQAMLRQHRLEKRVPAEVPWEARDAERLDALTLGAWVRRTTGTRAGRAHSRPPEGEAAGR